MCFACMCVCVWRRWPETPSTSACWCSTSTRSSATGCSGRTIRPWWRWCGRDMTRWRHCWTRSTTTSSTAQLRLLRRYCSTACVAFSALRCLQCFELPSVLWRCWLGGRKGIRPVKNWVLAWLSVWSEVQTCIWSSWCHCHSLSLAPVKSRLVLPFWYRPTQVVREKGPLNGCVCVCLAMYDCSPLQPSPYIKFTNSTDCGQMDGHTDPAEAESMVDRARAEEHWSYAGNDDDRVKQIHQRSLGRVHTWQPHRLHYSTHWTTPPHICFTAIIQVNLH